jgi:HSP20 family molecular chaperone IbpA
MTEDQKDLEVSEKKAIEKSDGEPTREGLMFQPHVDIVEDANAITLFADLPGVRKEDVDIDVREGVLTLTGPVSAADESWQSLVREFQMGGFTRRFTLSERIDTEKINAKLEHGVLRLDLPKVEQAKPRKIEIT